MSSARPKPYLVVPSVSTLTDLFHTCVGRPDSTRDDLDYKVDIAMEDILKLDNKLREKVSQYDSRASSFLAVFSTEKNRSRECSSLESLESACGRSTEVTERLILRWDFFFAKSDLNDPTPQHYQVMLDVSSRARPTIFFDSFTGLNFNDDPTHFSAIFLPAITSRVSYVDPLIGEEFNQVVKNWHLNLRRPAINSLMYPILKKLAPFARSIARWCALVGSGSLAIAVARHLARSEPSAALKTDHAPILAAWLVGALITVVLSYSILQYLARLVEKKSARASRFLVLELSDSDRNRKTRLGADVLKDTKKGLFSFAGKFVFSALQAVLSYLLF